MQGMCIARKLVLVFLALGIMPLKINKLLLLLLLLLLLCASFVIDVFPVNLVQH